MEDGPVERPSSEGEAQETIKNGVVPTLMVNIPEDSAHSKENQSYIADEGKVNGDNENNVCEEEYSSESDALVIDESVPKKPIHKQKRPGRQKGNKKVIKESEIVTHSNPFFNESLYELSQQHHNLQVDKVPVTDQNEAVNEAPASDCKIHKHKKGKGKSPKREYAQYLGLQPTVQFRCSKCGLAGFETLVSLNEHIVQCDAVLAVQPPPQESSSSSFKLTRKVFLCSACGTYYENWNLYLHMLELHRRFICLYCLGMFSAPNDLCQHIQLKHNLQPGHRNSLDEFFNVYSEPCYVVCCECKKLFNEEDNFFYHNCVKSGNSNNTKSNQKVMSKVKAPKVPVRPENHVTGDSGNSPVHTQVLSEQIVSENLHSEPVNKEPVQENEHVENELEEASENHIDNPLEPDNESTQSDAENNLDTSEKQDTAMDMNVAMEISNNSFDNLTLGDRLNTDLAIIENNDSTEVKSENFSEPQSEDEDNKDSLNSTGEDQIQDTSSEYVSEDPQLHQNNQNSLVEENITENSQHSNDSSDVTKELEIQVIAKPVDSIEQTEKETEKVYTEYENDEETNLNKSEENHLSDFDLEDSEMCDEQGNGDVFAEESEKRPDSSQDESELLENSENEQMIESSDHIETRKVPKLSLKLPKPGLFKETQDDSDDSEKLAMEVEQIESENEPNVSEKTKELDAKTQTSSEPQIQVAGPDVNIVELQLEQPLDKFDLRVLLQKCLKTTVPVCIYCNHARKIAVNGKQLALHAIAEHRYSAVVNSITAEELMPETFVLRIKESMDELENVFFSLDSGATDEGLTFSHVFECFQCRYSTTVHKELYLHNRKMHTKNLLLCIMCKSNFYSYSELICHLCPGTYRLDYDIQFRCCMCVSDYLPSAFRLLVHLRKRHHVCDVCLELCHTQYKLSNHVWKHKLHHFCYRCGIAYRNKPDITRHLFWKHGTESVLCKKCLQKKWPHVYHFCVPPSSFLCDECNLTFTGAVSLKVHKRIHSDEKPHACTVDDCQEHFISKKLLEKHERKHREPVEEPIEPILEAPVEEATEKTNTEESDKTERLEEKMEEKPVEKPKPKVDVYDLPELNLSESSDSDSEDEAQKKSQVEEVKEETKTNTEVSEESQVADNILNLNILENICETTVSSPDDTMKINIVQNEMERNNDFIFEPADKVAPILENVWDDFKNYQAEKEKIDHMFTDNTKTEEDKSQEAIVQTDVLTAELALVDHDYCVLNEPKVDASITEVKPDLSQRVDHDYCSPKGRNAVSPTKIDSDKTGEEEPKKSPRKRSDSTSSTSSSGSSSSSCTCGSNCSCSSSSGTSSSSSDSSNSDSSTEEGRKKQQLRRERRRERAKNINKKSENQTNETNKTVKVDQPPPLPPVVVETPIQESDLDTTETETDEEFYDKQPQKLAKKVLEEKRNQLLAEMGPVPNDTWLDASRPTTPGLPEEKPKKKSKSKKKKKHRSERKEQETHAAVASTSIPQPTFYHQFYQEVPTVAPITLTIARNSPVPSQTSVSQPAYTKLTETVAQQRNDDSNLRASKRRRVPNKFYGYSSDEDNEKGPPHGPKWRKAESLPAPNSPLTVPPITIKTAQIIQPPTVEPLTIRSASQTGELRVLPKPAPPPKAPPQKLYIPPVVPAYQHHQFQPPVQHHKQFQHNVEDSGSESNDSSSEENHKPPTDKPKLQPQLYCYCRCPYDEVSEMIGCDASDCAIEWFHFECVGIMVPPKGQWFCPDCRKKKQQKRNELLQT